MLKNLVAAQERWGGANDIIDRWLQERQDMLVLYCSLYPEAESQTRDEREMSVRRFCQILVDYVSAGHFEIYNKLVEGGRAEDNVEGLARAREYYQQVDATTEAILDFNDKYQETDDLSTLNDDLSKLGESLATRFEGEDAMIEVLHANRDRVA